MNLNLKKNPKVTELSHSKIQAYYYWWEFLKRSEPYKKICRVIRDRSDRDEDSPFPEVCRGITPKKKELTDLYFGWFYEHFTSEELSTVVLEEAGMTLYDVISRLYPLFHDVEQGHFNHVRWRLKWLYEDADARELGALLPGYDHLASMLHIQKLIFRKKYEREPSVDEFINFVLKQGLESDFDVMFISKCALPRKDLVPIFKDSLKQINIGKQPLNKQGMEYSWAAFLLDGQIKPDSFKMARKAYDLKTRGASPSKAISELFPQKYKDSNNDHKDLRKAYYDLLTLANTLIHNAETGNFPGKYSSRAPSTPKKRGRYVVRSSTGECALISSIEELI